MLVMSYRFVMSLLTQVIACGALNTFWVEVFLKLNPQNTILHRTVIGSMINVWAFKTFLNTYPQIIGITNVITNINWQN